MSVLWAHVSLGFQDNNVNLLKSSYTSEYDRFVSKVAECEDVLLYSKKREGTISEIETQFKESILEANKVLDEAEQMRNRTESLSKQASITRFK